MKLVLRFRYSDGTCEEKRYDTRPERVASLNQVLEHHRRRGHFVFGDGKRFTITDGRGVLILGLELAKERRDRPSSGLARGGSSTTLCSTANSGLARFTKEHL